MNEIFCHFWVLVFTHLVAGPIVLVLGRLLHGVAGRLISVVPGLETRSIRGTWNAEFQRGDDLVRERVEVSQFLRWIRGTIVNSTNNRHYSFRGRLREDVLVAEYDIETGSTVLDLGAFTLRLSDDGELLMGKYSWIDSKYDVVHADTYKWTKAR